MQNHEKWDNKRVVKIEKKDETDFIESTKILTQRGKRATLLEDSSQKMPPPTPAAIFLCLTTPFSGILVVLSTKKKQKHLQSLHPCMASAALVHPHSESKTLPVGALNRWASASASKTYSFRDMKRESGSGPDWPWGEVRKSSVVKGKRMVFGEAAAGKAAASQRDA